MFKTPQEWVDALNSVTPSVTVNKNGYEIRTELLGMAKNIIWDDYSAKWNEFEFSSSKEGDEDDSKIVTSVSFPAVPGIDQVLETADKLYKFVSQKNNI